MKLIVDSGSTKTAWLLGHEGRDIDAREAVCAAQQMLETAGINPVRDDAATVREVVGTAASQLKGLPREVHFYGAGCIEPYSQVVAEALRRAFPGAGVSVESDLLGAARALCGHREGIACILGTGANSCLYDGRGIRQQTPALGWILGDEGSGAVLGRRLVGDVLKGQLPAALCRAFLERFGLTQADIIELVYRRPQPNRFLASLVPFLAEHEGEEAVRAFLVREFRRFLVRNVAAYGRRDLPVSFVGGVAWQFQEQVREAARAEGFEPGSLLRSPIDGMARYHGLAGGG